MITWFKVREHVIGGDWRSGIRTGAIIYRVYVNPDRPGYIKYRASDVLEKGFTKEWASDELKVPDNVTEDGDYMMGLVVAHADSSRMPEVAH